MHSIHVYCLFIHKQCVVSKHFCVHYVLDSKRNTSKLNICEKFVRALNKKIHWCDDVSSFVLKIHEYFYTPLEN